MISLRIYEKDKSINQFFVPAMCDIQPELGRDIRLYSSGKMVNGVRVSKAEFLDKEMENQPDIPVPQAVTDRLSFTDKLLYIYTSGTTGLPKAAVIKHSRFMFACYALYNLCQVIRFP